jgi:hypothetical protein
MFVDSRPTPAAMSYVKKEWWGLHFVMIIYDCVKTGAVRHVALTRLWCESHWWIETKCETVKTSRTNPEHPVCLLFSVLFTIQFGSHVDWSSLSLSKQLWTVCSHFLPVLQYWTILSIVSLYLLEHYLSITEFQSIPLLTVTLPFIDR